LSVKVSQAVWNHANAKGSELLLLLAMADLVNDDGVCWASQETLSRMCRLGVRQVRDLQAKLTKSRNGLPAELEILDPGRGRGRTKHFRILAVERSRASKKPAEDCHFSEEEKGQSAAGSPCPKTGSLAAENRQSSTLKPAVQHPKTGSALPPIPITPITPTHPKKDRGGGDSQRLAEEGPEQLTAAPTTNGRAETLGILRNHKFHNGHTLTSAKAEQLASHDRELVVHLLGEADRLDWGPGLFAQQFSQESIEQHRTAMREDAERGRRAEAIRAAKDAADRQREACTRWEGNRKVWAKGLWPTLSEDERSTIIQETGEEITQRNNYDMRRVVSMLTPDRFPGSAGYGDEIAIERLAAHGHTFPEPEPDPPTL
jgi:hypothetical protein